MQIKEKERFNFEHKTQTPSSARFFSSSFFLAYSSVIRLSIVTKDSLVNGRKMGRSSFSIITYNKGHFNMMRIYFRSWESDEQHLMSIFSQTQGVVIHYNYLFPPTRSLLN